jgi:hypothetical protein
MRIDRITATPSQSLFRWQIGDVIEDGPFRQLESVVPVPTGPGLGVARDEQALEYWHRHFLEHGPTRPLPQSGAARHLPPAAAG